MASEFPYGQVSVRAVPGGLRTQNGTRTEPGEDHQASGAEDDFQR